MCTFAVGHKLPFVIGRGPLVSRQRKRSGVRQPTPATGGFFIHRFIRCKVAAMPCCSIDGRASLC